MIANVRNLDQVTIVSLSGDLDASISALVTKELKQLLGCGRNLLALDLEDVRIVDSSGLSAMLTTLKAARREGGNVVLLHLPSTVRPAIEITRLDRVFSIADNEAAALGAPSGAALN